MDILKRLRQQARVAKEYADELRREESYRGRERLVQITIQALLDLGLMILSAMGKLAKSYRDVATLLRSAGVLGLSLIHI